MPEKTAAPHQSVIPFQYESSEIRVIKDSQGEPWWITVDICKVLGLTNPSWAMKNLDDDEKTTLTFSDSQPGKGPQSLTAVNEPGLYTLIIRSNKPEAKSFKRWITHEVLPQIRKTGSYQSPHAAPLTPTQQRQIQKLIADKVYATGVQKKYAGVLFRQVYRQIKDTFGVAIYRDVPQNAFKHLMELIDMITLEQPKQISDVPEGFKKCSGCKQILPTSDFYQNRSTSDGLHHACIPCHKNALKRSISGTAEMERSIGTETVMENIVARAVETAMSKHTMMVYNQPSPVPATRQAKDWQSNWSILCDTHSDLSKAVEQLRKEVTAMLPQDHLQMIPKGVDVLEYIHLHYSPMERAARQINVLSELLMWKSPKVAGVTLELGKPRY